MLSFLTAAPNMPFAVAIGVMFIIVILEVVSVSLGAGFSEIIDSVIPELEADVDFDVDAGIDIPDASPTTIARVLTWFRVGEVPVLMLFVVFLTAFGLSGLMFQSIFQGITGGFMSPFVASIPVVFVTIPIVRVLAGVMGNYMPKDETYAVSEKSLIGRKAIIIAGTAKHGKPVQAKVKDEYGQTHYILVEPDQAGIEFEIKTDVILVRQNGVIFQAVKTIS